MCFIWRFDCDDFDTPRSYHVYLQDVIALQHIPFILGDNNDVRVIYHIWFNLRSRNRIVVVDELDNQYSVNHFIIWDVSTWAVYLFNHYHYARYDCHLTIEDVYGGGSIPVMRALDRWLADGGDTEEISRRRGFYPRVPGVTFRF